MSLFRSAVSAAIPALEAVFGEQFIITPQAYIGGRHGPDPARDDVRVTGIFTDIANIGDMIGERNASGMSKGVVSGSASGQGTIDFKRSAVPFEIKSKDRIERVETGEKFEVTGAPTNDLDHIFIRVVRLGTGI